MMRPHTQVVPGYFHELMVGAFDCLFYGVPRLIRRQFTRPRLQARSPCLPKTLSVPVLGVREPIQCLFGRSNAYLQTVFFENKRHFPAIYNHVCTSIENCSATKTAKGAMRFPRLQKNAWQCIGEHVPLCRWWGKGTAA